MAESKPAPTHLTTNMHGGLRLVCSHCGKSAYGRRMAAENAAEKINGSQAMQLEVYLGPECGWYHLSTRSESSG